MKNEKTSSVYQQSFHVTFNYQVWFTNDLFHIDNNVLNDSLTVIEKSKRHRIIVFVDEGVLETMPDLIQQIKNYTDHFSQTIELVAEPIIVLGGEKIKTDLSHIEMMQKAVFENQIDRHSFVIGIGGGAMLDAVGWVAATAHRGVRHIRIPTTVLSQNDSGVGVKNGVNLYGIKNYQGAFAPPWAVLNDIQFIMKLPARDQIAGIAEAVKVALIRDGEFFDWLESNAEQLNEIDQAAMEYMIRRCAELHMHQIANGGDPFETGSARPLDYGHWAAHKLESLTAYEIRHGEAVAIGLALDAHYSVLTGLLKTGDDERVCKLLELLGFDLWHPLLNQRSADGRREVLAGLSDFKEHLGGELTITLLKGIGTGFEVNEMCNEKLEQAFNWLEKRKVSQKS